MTKIEVYDEDAAKIMKIASRYGITMATVIKDIVDAFIEGKDTDAVTTNLQTNKGAEEI